MMRRHAASHWPSSSIAAERGPVGDRLPEIDARRRIARLELGLEHQHALAGLAQCAWGQRQEQRADGPLAVVDADVLGHVAHQSADRALALVGRQLPDQDLQQCALADPVRADESRVLPRCDAKRNIREQEIAARMGVRQIRNRHVRHGPIFPRPYRYPGVVVLTGLGEQGCSN